MREGGRGNAISLWRAEAEPVSNQSNHYLRAAQINSTPLSDCKSLRTKIPAFHIFLPNVDEYVENADLHQPNQYGCQRTDLEVLAL
jgi:hypothetical protein